MFTINLIIESLIMHVGIVQEFRQSARNLGSSLLLVTVITQDIMSLLGLE